MELTNLIIQVILALIAMGSVGFGVIKYLMSVLKEMRKEINDDIDRSYARLDEVKDGLHKKIDINQSIAHEKFMLKEIHEIERKHQLEMVDSKFANLISVFELNLKRINDNVEKLMVDYNRK